MKIRKDVIKRNRAAIILWVIFTAVCFTVSKLYGIGLEPCVYAAVLSLFFLLVFLVAELGREKRAAGKRAEAIAAAPAEWRDLPEARTAAEADYGRMIAILGAELERLTEEFGEERQDAQDYYTAWVHQIKTPIAVMKLELAEDTPENLALRAELFRIEQYVDMVLQYLRLGSDSNDLVIREYSLDGLIRETVRKYAPQFVEKKLRLVYTPTDLTVITDKKWFTCILEQLLSNAVKYTPAGSITVSAENGVLTVADTGIGIAAEDLPRIFEKGYTGLNGRIGQQSSGLGLYLAGKAAALLALSLRAESTPGQGSRFMLELNTKETRQLR